MTSKILVINIFYSLSVGLMLRILLSILNLPNYFAVVSVGRKEDICKQMTATTETLLSHGETLRFMT